MYSFALYGKMNIYNNNNNGPGANKEASHGEARRNEARQNKIH